MTATELRETLAALREFDVQVYVDGAVKIVLNPKKAAAKPAPKSVDPEDDDLLFLASGS